MDMNQDAWQAFSWHCPNCGAVVTGYKNSEGAIKVECGSCQVVMVRKIMGRRHDRFDLYAPRNEVNESVAVNFNY